MEGEEGRGEEAGGFGGCCGVLGSDVGGRNAVAGDCGGPCGRVSGFEGASCELNDSLLLVMHGDGGVYEITKGTIQ